MSNQKTTQLTNVTSNEVASGDLIPIVDVSATTSPTGETKHISAGNLGLYLASTISPSYSPYKTSNGVWFDENVSGSSLDTACYSPSQSLSLTDFTLSVRGMFPSSHSVVDSSNRIIFGLGTNPTGSVEVGQSAYIGIAGDDLVGHIQGTAESRTATIPDFFLNYADKTTHITFVSLGDEAYFYINGTRITALIVESVTGSLGTIDTNHVILGQSRATNNVASTILEAQIWNVGLSSSGSLEAFFAGPHKDSTLVASYSPDNLNPEPSQWLDSVGKRHLLLPTSGVVVTSPRKEFSLRFDAATSEYLGNGNARNVLPENYILTSVVVSSSAKPLLTLGSTFDIPVTGSSGTGSFYNNRVAWTSASYGINNLELLPLGLSHADRSLVVSMSGDNVCSFNIQGYVRD